MILIYLISNDWTVLNEILNKLFSADYDILKCVEVAYKENSEHIVSLYNYPKKSKLNVNK